MSSRSEDLALAFELADAADRVSSAHFRSEALRTTTKVDGTPVAEVDHAAERAMLEILRERRPADGVIGEEIGSHPQPGSRRWILDGIDGTHNYADGRPGWASIIALEVDGAVTLGLVRRPPSLAAGGRSWTKGRGPPIARTTVRSSRPGGRGSRSPARATWTRRR